MYCYSWRKIKKAIEGWDASYALDEDGRAKLIERTCRKKLGRLVGFWLAYIRDARGVMSQFLRRKESSLEKGRHSSKRISVSFIEIKDDFSF